MRTNFNHNIVLGSSWLLVFLFLTQFYSKFLLFCTFSLTVCHFRFMKIESNRNNNNNEMTLANTKTHLVTVLICSRPDGLATNNIHTQN